MLKKVMLPTNRDYYIMSCLIKDGKKRYVIMSDLSDEELNTLRKLQSCTICRGEKKFKLKPDNVVCFGDVDLSDNSKDSNLIAKCRLLKTNMGKIFVIPSNYSYEEHCYYIDEDNIKKQYDTLDIQLITKYAHGMIGKPKQIVIFTKTMKQSEKL